MPQKGYKHLTRDDRIQLEVYYKQKVSKDKIAKEMGFSYSTIWRELKRGEYIRTTSTLEETVCYSSCLAEERYQEGLRKKGPSLKIGNDIELANFIENKIVQDKYSPEAALAAANNSDIDFKVHIRSKTTIYSYITKGIFFELTNDHLPQKRNPKRKYNKVRVRKKALRGKSIEKRAECIDSREEFGHWEMDSVIGTMRCKKCLLVLTERKTRCELLFLLLEKKACSVVEIINKLEREWGELFPVVFKSFTVDNGSEFDDYNGMRLSLNDGVRTEIYYCHPYSSWERGSNEVNNKLIRRHYPKGYNFSNLTDEDIEILEVWINNYPRPMFNYRSSQQLLGDELVEILDSS